MILTKLGKAFFLLTIAMVESESPPIHEECCFEKMVGGVSYSLFHDVFHGSIPHQCLSGCVYTRSGTSSPKFCFQRGDLRAECLSDVPVALVGGEGPWEGNVMIYGKPVCDDDWGHEDANVVCRQLGYLYGEPTERSYFGAVSSDFAFDNVDCRGDEEYIWRCPHVTEDHEDCGSHEGAGVICSNEAPVVEHPGSGSGSGSGAPVIELVGGSGPHEGNIMLYGRPVCDDIATPENAEVVCRQLGYLGGYITTNSFFGRVSSDFIMDDVNCNGTEEYIWRCPHDTQENCGGSDGMGVVCSNEEPGSGSGSGLVMPSAMVVVKSATTAELVADVSVQLVLGETMTTTTDVEGRAIFTLSPHMADMAANGAPATIEVSGAGYASVVVERNIFADEAYPVIQIFTSPELREGEHRVVLSWDTSTDLDIYVLQMDKDSGDIVCKTYWSDSSSCPGVNLDIDVYEYGPETITWTDADNDAHSYMIYVHDYNQGGVAGTGARITLYGETQIEMEVADGDSGELWWVIGTFEPALGTSSFSTIDELHTIDPDFRPESRSGKKGQKSQKGQKGK